MGADLALANVDAEGLEAVAAGLGTETLVSSRLASEQSGYITKWSASPTASTRSVSEGSPAGDRPAGGTPS